MNEAKVTSHEQMIREHLNHVTSCQVECQVMSCRVTIYHMTSFHVSSHNVTARGPLPRRYKCVEVTALLSSSVVQAATVRYCSCSDRLIRYLCEQIGDTIEGDISSPTLVITDETLLITCVSVFLWINLYKLSDLISCTFPKYFRSFWVEFLHANFDCKDAVMQYWFAVYVF